MADLIDRLRPLRDRALALLKKQQPLALLLARLSVGLIFISTGWGKVTNLAKVTEYFRTLGIPAPELQAPLASYTELLCGLALIIGLLTRLAAIPLMVTMIVAILTAKRADIHGFFDLVGFEEFTYLLILAIIVILGPGNWSVDRVLGKKFGDK